MVCAKVCKCWGCWDRYRAETFCRWQDGSWNAQTDMLLLWNIDLKERNKNEDSATNMYMPPNVALSTHGHDQSSLIVNRPQGFADTNVDPEIVLCRLLILILGENNNLPNRVKNWQKALGLLGEAIF